MNSIEYRFIIVSSVVSHHSKMQKDGWAKYISRMDMLYGCLLSCLIHFWSEFTLWKKFIALQMKVFGNKKFQVPCTGLKVLL